MLPPDRLRVAFAGIARIALAGPWYRAVAYRHVLGPPPGEPHGARPQPLWAGGSKKNGARFTPKGELGFDSLYLGSDETTVLHEIARVLTPPNYKGPLFFPPHVLMTIAGVLTDVLDLTDQSVRDALDIDVQTLTGAWTYSRTGGEPAPTQVLGRAAFDQGRILGLKYPSSKTPAGFGVAIFTERLPGTQNWLEVHDPGGALTQRLP